MDTLITDFSAPAFQAAFRQYFAEIGISVRDWEGLFREMNQEGNNAAFLRTTEEGEVIGFLQFQPIAFTSWFFEETCGFIREFWVAKPFRGQGHGTGLLGMAEQHFRAHGMFTAVLTTDTAAGFYEKRGYVRARGCRAKNGDEVFMTRLGSD